MSKKVLIIGIDGGTWSVLKPAMEQGYMPFLKHLCDNGASGILESTIPAITPAAWGAFQTGKNPGKTGVFDFAFWDRTRHESQYVNSLDLGTTLWDILSRHNKRVAVINVPMTYPPKPINGYLISGLVTPSLESDFCWPHKFKQQLLQAHSQYHIFDLKQSKDIRAEDNKIDEFIQQMQSIIECRTQVALWLIEKEPFDVFVVHFQASDVLQHVYWHYLDPSHPLFNASKQQRIFNTFYRTLDQKIKEIYNCFCESNGKPLTVLLSDHGFQSHYKRFNLGNWLEKEGYLKINTKAAISGTPFIKKMTRLLRVGKWLSLILPKKTVGSVDKKYISRSELFNWNQTLACAVGRSGEGFVYCLAENKKFSHSIEEEIRQKLTAVIDPETGRQVVRKVWLKSELYQGDKTVHLPDLTVEPQDGYSFTGYYQFGQGIFHCVNPKDDKHMGKHHRDGIIIIEGKGVLKNSQLTANIVDLAPTLLAFMEIPIPEQMDGKLVSEVFNNNLPISYVASDKEIDKEIRFSEDEHKQIENRLKDLGYL